MYTISSSFSFSIEIVGVSGVRFVLKKLIIVPPENCSTLNCTTVMIYGEVLFTTNTPTLDLMFPLSTTKGLGISRWGSGLDPVATFCFQ